MNEKIFKEACSGITFLEDTIFDRSVKGKKGYKFSVKKVPLETPTSPYSRKKDPELPEVSELDVVRHFTRLSSWNYSVDTNVYPLGSCTMKYNPRILEEIASYDSFSMLHPELPEELTQGALECIYLLQKFLCSISGLDECSTNGAAGAHGEFIGLSIIRAFHEYNKREKSIVLVPDSAHGTNPASTSIVGYTVIAVKSSSSGVVELNTIEEAVKKYGDKIAALMITNPNTLGIFESNIIEISRIIHSVNAELYLDGANYNAIVGFAKPADMGVDVMHFNLHKTFGTPHGGGGPGAGPVAVKKHLEPFLPNPRVILKDGVYKIHYSPYSIGRVKNGFGNFLVLIKALVYILLCGKNGLKNNSKRAVLNANYLKHELSRFFELPYKSPSLHEFVLSDKVQNASYGIKTLHIAKTLIDYGFHPPTIYFPLIVQGAMLFEPTESESLKDLKALIDAMTDIVSQLEERKEEFENSPRKTFIGKVDEVGAARKAILTLDDRTV